MKSFWVDRQRSENVSAVSRDLSGSQKSQFTSKVSHLTSIIRRQNQNVEGEENLKNRNFQDFWTPIFLQNFVITPTSDCHIWPQKRRMSPKMLPEGA